MSRPGRLPADISLDGFTVQQATAAGVTRGRLRSSDLASPFHGIRARPGLTTVAALARALSPRLTPDQYFSHTTAAALLGLRLPEGLAEVPLHVTSVRPHRAPRIVGVSGHESGRAAVISIDGIPVLNAVDTWIQLAATLSLDDVVAMGDGLVRRTQPMATLAHLRLAVQSHRGRGGRRLRAAVELVRAGTDSARETALRLLVLRAGFPEPEVNGLIRNTYDAPIAHGDLVFMSYRTILEYEGRQHSESTRQFAIDIARLDELMDEGWRVIRVDRWLIARRATLLDKIDRALRHGGWSPAT